MIIQLLRFNWMPALSDGKDIYSEQYEERSIGVAGVVKIEEYKPKGEGDKWHYDVTYADGSIERVFNPNYVNFLP